jgi:LCP family protein required for cell wall assembly
MALNRREGVYTILLAATDKDGTRTDTMMVMCYDTEKQTVGVVSIPRDSLIDRGSGHHPKLVYGKGGVEQRVEDISQMLGIPIDGYIKVNIKGFITLVDYLGGIDFYVPCDMDYDDPIQDLSIHYKEGQRKLSGQQAMEVARFRKNNDGSGYSDVGRTQTQQKLLIALAKKVLSWDSLTKVNGFVEIFNKNVSTDLTLDNMMYFASQAINLDPSAAVETATLPGRGDGVYRGYRYCYELDPEGTLELVNRLINPYSQDLTLDDMNLAKADKYM